MGGGGYSGGGGGEGIVVVVGGGIVVVVVVVVVGVGVGGSQSVKSSSVVYLATLSLLFQRRLWGTKSQNDDMCHLHRTTELPLNARTNFSSGEAKSVSQ